MQRIQYMLFSFYFCTISHVQFSLVCKQCTRMLYHNLKAFVKVLHFHMNVHLCVNVICFNEKTQEKKSHTLTHRLEKMRKSKGMKREIRKFLFHILSLEQSKTVNLIFLNTYKMLIQGIHLNCSYYHPCLYAIFFLQ